jgi:cytochrome P450
VFAVPLNQPNDLSHCRFDPLAPQVLADPYPFYAWLRAHDPIHWGAGGSGEEGGCWYVTSYDDAVALLKDARLGREIDKIMPERVTLPADADAAAIIRQWMVLRDPPWHTYLRGLVHRAFTPQMIERWTPRMEAIVGSLLAQVDANGFDLIHDVAVPFPVLVVAEMLGVPPADAPLFTPWTKALAAVIEFEQTPEVAASGAAAMRELADYLRGIIAQRRRQPQDDLISALLGLAHESPISEDVLIGACTQLLFGGNDPVAHLIGNGVLALLRHLPLWTELGKQPVISTSTVDEVMRYDSSVQMTFRYALTDVEWQGKTMRTGDLVAIVFGAANRDGNHFVAPDILDLNRTPNRHLSLGQGIHYCLGAALARTEGRIILGALCREMPSLHLAQDEIRWQRTVAVRGLTTLRVANERHK